MNFSLITIAALLPALVLIYYINRKDCQHPEPRIQLIKGFLYGVVSALLVLLIAGASGIADIANESPSSISEAVSEAFLAAAIPEELAKLLMLWLLVRRNRHFDEHMDGIVYAVCVGMGFAGTENILYLFDNINDWATVGVIRALISVPGHFFFAVAMGYYFSIVCFGSKESRIRNVILMLAVPILLHGIFDAILMSIPTAPELYLLLTIAFFAFFRKTRKFASSRIEALLGRDTIDSDTKQS